MKHYITLILMLSGYSIATADTLSEDMALANAVEFMQLKGTISTMSRAGSPKLTKALQGRGYYAFNIGDADGYIISSASTLTQPVLGYSTQGSLDRSNMPDPLKYWLESIDTAIENIEAGIPQTKNHKVNQIQHVADKQPISPLLTCQWSQDYPYNLLTPSYLDQNTGNYYEHSATGCVATATTQLMYYWKWPQEACATIPSYTYNWLGNVKTTETLPPIQFDWDAMTDTYDGNSSQESKMAVAQLMLYAGYGMQSGYAAATGATSLNALSALQSYFGYSHDAYNVYHLNYTFQEWEDLFYNELAAGRPLLMGADNYERTGGHAFVCDGYDGNGLYHMNWGWGGWDNGYFVLTVMAPDNQGIGGSTDANGYSMGQNACVNLHPDTGDADQETVNAAISLISATQSKLRKDANNDFTLNFSYMLHAILMHQYNIDHAFRLMAPDSDEIIADELAPESLAMHPANRYNGSASVKFNNLANGTYALRGISRLAGTDEWLFDNYSERNYIQLVVNDDEMIVNVMPGQGTKLVVNSLSLDGATVAGQWQPVIYNITNNGNDFYGETYLFVDGVRSSGNTINIPAGETVDVYYKIKPDESVGTHNFILSLSTDTNSGNVISDIDRMYNTDCLWCADGSINPLPQVTPGSNYVVPEDAVALYLYGSTPRSISVSSANPNLVLYLDEDASLSSRVESIMRKYITNIVIGGKAKEAAFKDGFIASIPMAFEAETVSYTRENMPRWSTLALPFDVAEIAVDGIPVEWFTSKDDTGKNLFVKRFAGTRSSQVRFSHTAAIQANTPYFVGLEGNLNGSSFNHTGKSVTFSATNAIVQISGETTDNFVANGVKMLPCYSKIAKSKLLGLDENMENFTQVATTEPFHAYISTSSSATQYSVYYDQGENSGILEVLADESQTLSPSTPVYNLMGVKVAIYADFDNLLRGFYIVAGRKIAKL